MHLISDSVCRLCLLTDLHIGTPRVAADSLREHLRKYLYPKLIKNKINILVVGGDFFDTLLNLNSTAGYHAILIIQDLLNLAIQEGFYIRVDRGTFLHDRHQNQIFLQYSDTIISPEQHESRRLLHGEPLVKIFDTISVEHINSLNIDILYIPDDLPKIDIYEAIQHQLDLAHISQVDIVVSHGYFEHLLPKGLPHQPPNTLSQDRMKQFVKGVVLNGHIHTPSVYKNVVSGGSFERFCHHEEEDKGFYIIDYNNKTNECQFEFNVNHDALCFRHIRLTDMENSEAQARYQKFVEELTTNHPDQSIFVQIITDDLTLKQVLEAYTRQHYPNVHYTARKVESNDKNLNEIKFSVADLPLITEANLLDMVYAQLQLKNEPYSLEQIKGVIDAV